MSWAVGQKLICVKRTKGVRVGIKKFSIVVFAGYEYASAPFVVKIEGTDCLYIENWFRAVVESDGN